MSDRKRVRALLRKVQELQEQQQFASDAQRLGDQELDARVARCERIARRACELVEAGEGFAIDPAGIVRFRDGRVERIS